MKRTAFVAVALAAVVPLVGACRDDGIGPEPGPQPGALFVELDGSADGIRSLLLRVSGPDTIRAVTAVGSEILVYAGGPGRSLRAAAFGRFAEGSVLRLDVRDVRVAGHYAVVVLEAGDSTHALQPSWAGRVLPVRR